MTSSIRRPLLGAVIPAPALTALRTPTVRTALLDRREPLPVRLGTVDNAPRVGLPPPKTRSRTGIATRTDVVSVFAYESHDGGPAGLQPIARRHFDVDADGKITGLTGPRVSIEMPATVVTKLDDLTFKPAEFADSNFPRAVLPNHDGRFAFDQTSPLTGATTAFYAATTVIDAGERWAGGDIAWGNGGKLRVVPYRFVTDFFNAYFDSRDKTLYLGALGRMTPDGMAPHSGRVPGWEKEVRKLFLDGAKNRDIVAHEAGHALLDALKPGLHYGMGRALNEGIADTIAVLTAFEDPDVVRRVLIETRGDLSQLNEAARVAETIGTALHRHRDTQPSNDDDNFMRAATATTTLDGSNVDRTASSVPGMGMVPSRDPHVLGQIAAGAHYDIFVRIYEKARAAGATDLDAIATARDATGALVLRATRHIGEHQASLRDWALALVQTEASLFDGDYRDIVREVLEEVELVDAGEDLDAVLSARLASMPDFSLSGDVTDPTEIMQRLERLEASQVTRAKAGEEVHVLIRHNRYVPDFENIGPEELSVASDQTFNDGVRVLRLSRDVTVDAGGYGQAVRETQEYISLVFDPDGRLVDFHRDAPKIEEF